MKNTENENKPKSVFGVFPKGWQKIMVLYCIVAPLLGFGVIKILELIGVNLPYWVSVFVALLIFF